MFRMISLHLSPVGDGADAQGLGQVTYTPPDVSILDRGINGVMSPATSPLQMTLTGECLKLKTGKAPVLSGTLVTEFRTASFSILYQIELVATMEAETIRGYDGRILIPPEMAFTIRGITMVNSNHTSGTGPNQHRTYLMTDIPALTTTEECPTTMVTPSGILTQAVLGEVQAQSGGMFNSIAHTPIAYAMTPSGLLPSTTAVRVVQAMSTAGSTTGEFMSPAMALANTPPIVTHDNVLRWLCVAHGTHTGQTTWGHMDALSNYQLSQMTVLATGGDWIAGDPTSMDSWLYNSSLEAQIIHGFNGMVRTVMANNVVYHLSGFLSPTFDPVWGLQVAMNPLMNQQSISCQGNPDGVWNMVSSAIGSYMLEIMSRYAISSWYLSFRTTAGGMGWVTLSIENMQPVTLATQEFALNFQPPVATHAHMAENIGPGMLAIASMLAQPPRF